MTVPLKRLVLPDDPPAAVDQLRRGIDAAFSDDVAIAPVSENNRDVRLPSTVPADTAAVITTSGSTGQPKRTALSRQALQASAGAVREALGGAGGWLLTLPPSYIAGFQVVARSVLFDTPLVCLDSSRGFTAESFTEVSKKLASGRRYVSLVPTQLKRILASSDASKELARFDHVLIGGAPLEPETAQQASTVAPISTTYGMTETCGGCIHDGIALRDVRVRIIDGEVHLGGPVLASGYLGDDQANHDAFYEDASGRWFRTADRGQYINGLLQIQGRLDDVINTGGAKVPPRTVDESIQTCTGVEESLTLGVPDAEWGEAVASYVCTRPGAEPSAEHIRATVRNTLNRYSVPRHLIMSPDPLRLPNGKLDRVRIHEQFLRRKEHQ